MLCERAQELFSEYHEGAVKPAMRVPLESHLGECAACRTRLEGMRDIWKMLDGAPLVEPPPDFRATVWARIDAAEAEKARKKQPAFAFDWRSLFRPATLGWATAALAVLLLAPTVIPGARSVAGLWFPWSLFYQAPAASRAHVTIGQPQVTIQDNKKWIDLQVSNTGSAAAKVEVKVDGSASAPIVIEASPGTNKWYHVAPADNTLTRLEATWSENGQARSQELMVTQ